MKHILSIFALFTVTLAPFCVSAEEIDERTAGSKPSVSQRDYSETYKMLNLFGDVFERVRLRITYFLDCLRL